MEPKKDTISDYQQRIIRVLIYVERHLDQPLGLEDLARASAFSPYHFHRIFRAFVGEPLYAYIKRLRLEKAALNVRSTQQAITDVSFQAGYETPAAFSKAFRERFGVTPSGFRQNNWKKAAENGNGGNGSFAILEETMKPEIRFVEDQKVLFVRRTGPYDVAAAEAWKTLMRHAFWRMLFNRDTKIIGISHDDPEVTEQSKLRYDACMTVKGDVKPKGELGVQTLPGGKYAVFLHKGPYDQIDATYDQIFSAWLPQSPFKLRDTPCYEMYLKDPRRTKPENLETQIYVPIQ